MAFLLVFIPLAKAQPAEGPDADAIFATSMATMEALNTLRVEYKTAINEQARLAFGGMPDTTTLFEAALPGCLRMAFTAGDSRGLIVIGDGELKIYDATANRCAVTAAPEAKADAIVEAFARGGGVVSQGDVLFVPMMMVGAFSETWSDPKSYEGLETIDGVECHHLTMGSTGAILHFWAENTEQALPRRVLVVVPEGQIPGTEGDVDLIDVQLTRWDLDPTFDQDTFVFTPPEGTEIVETLAPEPMAPSGAEFLGVDAPTFEASTLDGGTLKLEDLIGEKIIVLDFWATWCEPCIQALPIVTRVTGELADQGVEFWAVNQGEDVETIKAFLAERGLSPNVALDTVYEVAEAYGVQGIPTTVIIGLDGSIQAYHVGYDEGYEESLKAELEALLAGESLASEPPAVG